jgi:LCCL domain
MGQGTFRAAVAGLLVTLALAACGGDDDASADDTTTTEAEETSTTEDEGTTTTAPEGETTTEADDSATPEDEIATAWRANAVEHRADPNGTEHDYECPPDGIEDTVWGTETYTDDSSVCNAGVHAGAITYEDGGIVTIVIEGPQESFDGSESFGVTSQDYPAWPGSFSISGVD